MYVPTVITAGDLKTYELCLVEEVSGARCGVLVKALRYKPAGRGFDSR